MSIPLHQPRPRPPGAPQDVFWTRLAGSGSKARRTQPRVHAQVPVRISVRNGERVDLITNDLSLRGMQVRCGRDTAMRLSPKSGSGGAGPVYGLCLDLEVGQLSLRVNGHGRIVHLSRVSGADPGGEVAVGVQFLGFQDAGDDVLRRFVEAAMEPAQL